MLLVYDAALEQARQHLFGQSRMKRNKQMGFASFAKGVLPQLPFIPNSIDYL